MRAWMVVMVVAGAGLAAAPQSMTSGKSSSTLLEAGEAPARRSAVKAKVGDEVHLLLRLTSRVKVADGPMGTFTEDMLVPLKLRVEAAPAQGGATVMFEVEAAREGALSDAQRARAAEFIGRRGRYQLSPTGHLRSIAMEEKSGSEDYRRTIGLGTGSFDVLFVGLLEGWAGLGDLAPQLPIGVGTRWKSVSPITKGGQTTTSTATHTRILAATVGSYGRAELVGRLEAEGQKMDVKATGTFELALLEKFPFMQRALFDVALTTDTQSLSSRFTLEVTRQ